MKKSLAERFEEMARQNVPDETLTRAFDEGDARVVEEYAAAPRWARFGFRPLIRTTREALWMRRRHLDPR
jgi:hypothetical protein